MPDAVEVTNVHLAAAREVREIGVWIKSNTKIADRRVRGEDNS